MVFSRCLLLLLIVALVGLPFAMGEDNEFKKPEIQIHGFLSQGYLKSTDNNYLVRSSEGSFEFTEAAVNFQSQLTDKLRVGIQVFSRDLGADGNNKLILDWAYGDYKVRDEFGIRAGRIKMPFGFYNQGRDVDMLRSTILLPGSIYSESVRNIIAAYNGLGAYGRIPTKAGDFEYELGVGSNSIDEEIPYFKDVFLSMGMGSATDRSIRMKWIGGGRIIWNTPLEGLRFGLTHGANHMVYEGTLGTTHMTIHQRLKANTIVSAEYTRNNLTLCGEYNRISIEIKTPLGISSFPREGYYGQASYRFHPKFEMASYYSVYYPNAHDKDGKRWTAQRMPNFLAWQKDFSLTGRFDITSFWLIKAEVHRMNGTGLCNVLENATGLKKDWTLLALKTTFNF